MSEEAESPEFSDNRVRKIRESRKSRQTGRVRSDQEKRLALQRDRNSQESGIS